MSYSICLNCKEMVFQYEKYCDKCADKFTQDALFWKTHDYSFLDEPKRSQELLVDEDKMDEKAKAILNER